MNGVLLEPASGASAPARSGRGSAAFYGTSAGALAGAMAALDRLDDLEDFLLGLQPGDRPQRLWRLPLNGLHEYTLPETISERLFPPLEPRAGAGSRGRRGRHLRHRCRTTRTAPLVVRARLLVPPDAAGDARAGRPPAAMSALVLPLPVVGPIATDGGWTRNFPLGEALEIPT